jgi:hypothetical protein
MLMNPVSYNPDIEISGLFQDYLHSPAYEIDTPFPYASH